MCLGEGIIGGVVDLSHLSGELEPSFIGAVLEIPIIGTSIRSISYWWVLAELADVSSACGSITLM